MKTISLKSFFLVALSLVLLAACKQDTIDLQQKKADQPTTPKNGNVNFSKYVSIGNSLTAGYQAGALFTEGQNNSFPLILSQQFSLAQGTTITFNQPDINSLNGFNSAYSVLPSVVLGRLVLFAADGIQAHAVPTPAGAPGVPAPYNSAGPDPTKPAFMYTGDTTKLNNFGVPGIILVQGLTPDTGNPAKTAFNPYYYRFASKPGVSTIIGDAIRKQPTFFTFDLGNNDVLGYATTGGDGSVPITDQGSFATYYQSSIGLLMAKTSASGVVATIPYVTDIPFFLTIKYNQIPLDDATATQLMSPAGFGGYNQVLGGLSATLTANPAAFGLSSAQAAPIIAQIATRYVNYAAGPSNSMLIKDETLIDLGPFFDGLLGAGAITQPQRDGLTPYQQVRQTTSDDLIPLTAGGILGTLVGGNPLLVNGVSVPLADKYVLIPSEQSAIKDAIDGFNTTIKSTAAAFSARVAVADVNAAFTTFTTHKTITADGVIITPNFTPPFGAFSEDGVHPNSRGYAYMANIFIDAINNKTEFGAFVPAASLADHSGVGLPLVP